MATEVDICNLALAHLSSQATITSINPADGTAQAAHCARFYPIARNIALTAHPWAFARKLIAPALLGEYSGSWFYKFSLPTDSLRPLEVHPNGYDNPQPFDIEVTDTGRILLTNQNPINLRYIYRAEDTLRYSDIFIQALSWLLASYLTGPVIGAGSDKIRNETYAMYVRSLSEAAKIDDEIGKQNVIHKIRNYQPSYITKRNGITTPGLRV